MVAVEEGLRDLEQAVEQQGDILLLAQVLLTKTRFRFHLRLMPQMAVPEAPMPPKTTELVWSLIGHAEEAAQLFGRFGALEDQMSAILLTADMKAFLGDSDGARTVAENVVGTAEVLGLERLVAWAKEHIDGEWEMERSRKALSDLMETDNDVLAASATDDDLPREAAAMMEVYQLPRERMPVVVREFESIRMVSRERLDWCRHMGVVQDLNHTKSRETFYATDPDRKCRCEMHGYQSAFGSTRKLYAA